MSQSQFQRTERLLGECAMKRLAAAHVMVFGLGGVGGAAAEALARAGVGRLTLVDADVVEFTNLNRQLIALHSTLGLPKAEVAAARCRDINPACTVLPRHARYTAETREDFFGELCDYIIDAIDSVTDKLDLIVTAKARGVPILSAMGTGNKLDPTQLRVADIGKTEGCPLARVMRRELRRRDIHHLKVVFSPERPRGDGERTPASSPWVPVSAGLLMAAEAVRDLTGAW